MKRTIHILAALAVLASGAGCHEKPHEDALAFPGLPPAAVKVQRVEPQRIVATEEVVGTVQAKIHASIEAKVNARIEELPVAPGSEVTEGEVLAVLDDREIRARLEQAIAQRDQAFRDTERLRHLLSLNAVSRQDFETAESRHRVAVAAVNEAETMLGYTKVTAPFSGVITRKFAEVGDLPAPGKPLLQLEDPSLYRLEADVPEALIGKIELGSKLKVRVSHLEQEFEGQVSEIAPAADRASRTFLVKMDLPNAQGLRSGLFGRVAIPVQEVMALRVPRQAVVKRGQLEFVFVPSDGEAVMRIVKTGRLCGDDVELISGVEAGETVVVEGASQLRDGQPLEVGP